MLNKMIRFLKFIFNICIFIISFAIPKSNKYVVVGGWEGKRFADNSRGLFEYLNSNKEKIGLERIFWYTNSQSIYNQLKIQGYDVLYGLNLKSIFWHLRSGVHFIDQNPRDILGYLSIRATRINLWHGVPLKKIGVDTNPNYRNGRKTWRKWTSAGFWTDQYVLATSEFAKRLLVHAMDISEDKGIVASYPRNEKLYYNKVRKISKYDVMNVYYLPTYRANRDKNPILYEDMSYLNDQLKKNNIFLKIKPHFASISDWEIVEKYSNIQLLDAELDVYDGLLETDLLITDYSSVYFDFLLTDKPILFYPYDLEHYRDLERGFTMSYEDHTPGTKVYSYGELLSSLLRIKSDYIGYQKEYEIFYQSIKKKMNLFTEEPNYYEILKFLR
ncbi:CDP-glycerol glycerophosphotransferase family protein [Streptococcus suis]|uniref:CDP-glycerol glycerophosphotransferase family protein n=1 Tax=Streptococcus suis TaxID=1307 RepID=UPI0014797707